MEGRPPCSGNVIMPGVGCEFLGLQGSSSMETLQEDNPQFYQHFSVVGSQNEDALPLGVEYVQDFQLGGQGSVFEDDEVITVEEDVDGFDEVGEEMGSPWQRIKWTEEMVRLLITALSYIGEDLLSGCSSGHGKKKSLVLHKMGRWKCISRAMVERGYVVSPQQCEDKFNDLNKRYNKLNRVLGRGIACKVVENPELLHAMNLTVTSKEGVRRILSSKHLFFELMCSYHNRNRLFLPHDPELQLSLELALASKTDSEVLDSKGPEAASFDEHQGGKGDDHLGMSWFPQMLDQADESQDVVPVNFLKNSYCDRIDPQQQNLFTELNQFCPKGNEAEELQSRWLAFRSLQLKEQKLRVEAQMIEIQKQQCKWQRISSKRDRELDKMRLENQCLKLENERMALQFKHRKLGATTGSNN